MRIGEGEASRIEAGLKKGALIAALGLLALISLDLADRLATSTPGYAIEQLWKSWTGGEDEGLQRARAQLEKAERVTGIGALSWVRVGRADRLGDRGAEGLFNPFALKISLAKEPQSRGQKERQRWVGWHEIGHAAALLSGRWSIAHPKSGGWGLDQEQLQEAGASLMVAQIYAESFADVFAMVMSMKEDQGDPQAWMEMAMALQEGPMSVSIAHDTARAMRAAKGRLETLRELEGGALLGEIDAIASQAALRTLADWGAEREALCQTGLWGLARWLRDEGHMIASDPWRMASPSKPEPGEPKAELLSAMIRAADGQRESRLRWASGLRPLYQSELDRWGKEPAAGGAMMAGAASEKGGWEAGQRLAWAAALAQAEPKAKGALGGALAPLAGAIASAWGQPRPWGCDPDEPIGKR